MVVPHRLVSAKFWDWLDTLHVTWSALVPTIISQLAGLEGSPADRREAHSSESVSSRSSSAPFRRRCIGILDKFNLPLIQAMGSTEGGNVFSNPLPPGKNKIGSPGLPWGFETRIVDPEGVEVRREPGEVLIRGAALMRAITRIPKAPLRCSTPTVVAHRRSRLRDEDGYFFVVGRSKELIIKGGVNIAPRQIDEVLESHPAVLEAAAVGVPDQYLGEDSSLSWCCGRRWRSTRRNCSHFVRSRLGHFKTPTRITSEGVAEGPLG